MENSKETRKVSLTESKFFQVSIAKPIGHLGGRTSQIELTILIKQYFSKRLFVGVLGD